MKSREFVYSFKRTVPVLLGYSAIGIAFGLLMAGAGFKPWTAILMSVCVFAGAGQYLGVSLLAGQVPLGEVALLTLLVNARHMAYGISLIDRFRQWPALRPYLVFALTDETYALMTNLDIPEGLDRGRVHGLIAGMNQCWWVTGTAVGVFAGTMLPIPTDGMEFALTALFAVLVVDRWREGTDRVSFLIGAAGALAGALIFGVTNLLLPAIGFAIVVLVLVPPGSADSNPGSVAANEGGDRG